MPPSSLEQYGNSLTCYKPHRHTANPGMFILAPTTTIDFCQFRYLSPFFSLNLTDTDSLIDNDYYYQLMIKYCSCLRLLNTHMNETKILIIEDDIDINQSLASFLKTQGYHVETCPSAEVGHEWMKKNSTDLILLDLMLPGENGFEFFRKVRAEGGPAVIMLTALEDPADNILGLELGADDYVTKPFDLHVLLARIRSVLRRSTSHDVSQPKLTTEMTFQFSAYTFYPLRRYLRGPGGLRKSLTANETNLLVVLCQNVNKLLSRENLLELTRADDCSPSTRTIDILISRLRKKLADDQVKDELIQTFRNGGYMFRPEVNTL